MSRVKDERFGFWFDEFVRAWYVVGCMFLDVMLVGQFLIETSGTWWGIYLGGGILVLLIISEVFLYFRIWKDFRVSITDVEFDKPFVVKGAERSKINISIQNEGYRAIRDAIIEVYINGSKIGQERFSVEKNCIKSVTFHWVATPGRHHFGIRILARESKKRPEKEDMDMVGEFVVRKGKKVASTPHDQK
jgi:hypothetical protein